MNRGAVVKFLDSSQRALHLHVYTPAAVEPALHPLQVHPSANTASATSMCRVYILRCGGVHAVCHNRVQENRLPWAALQAGPKRSPVATS